MLNIPHRHRLPQDSSDLSAYPTIVMLHGWLGNENVMWAFESALPKNVVVVSPRAPLKVGDGYGWSYRREHPDFEDSFTNGLAALREFIQGLPSVYPVDPNKIYLMGFSQGAATSYSYALAHPQDVAGVIALAGFLPDPAREWLIPNCWHDKPVLISHGTQDQDVPLAQAHDARDALAITGAKIEYHQYDTAHKLNAQGMRDLKTFLSQLA